MRSLIRRWIRWKSEFTGVSYTQDMLARDAGIYSSNLSEYMTGKVEPNKRTLEKLARVFEVSLAEFLTGPPSGSGGRRSASSGIPLYDQEGERVDSLSTEEIPLLTGIPAGPWMAWVDTYPPGFGEDAVPRYGIKGGHIFAVRVEGDSMVPDLRTGDVLVIDPERAFTNTKGGIGVVKFDDSYKIRRVWLRGDNYLLEPSNKAYEPEFIPVTGTTIFKIVEVRPRLDERF
ncbi:MAG: S24 family peptidase [Candidatus Latescibacterota bacterium]